MKRIVGIPLFISVLSCLFSVATNAQTLRDVDPDVAGIHPNNSPVTLDGKTLFFVGGIASYPADQRAATINRRLKKVAANLQFPVDSIVLRQYGDHYQIYAEPEFIMNVFTNDAGTESVNLILLAELMQTKIKESITEYRHDRSGEIILRKSFFAIGATVLFIVCIILIRLFTRWINRITTQRLKASVDLLENKSQKVLSSAHLWKTVNILFRAIKWFLTAILALAYTGYVLRLFPWTSTFAGSAIRAFLKPVADIGKAVLNYLPSLIFLILIILITRYLLKLVKLFFTGIDKGGIILNDFYPEWAMPTFKILRTGIVAFAVILAFPYIPGSKSDAFKGVTVFIGILFSLGSSSFIANIIAGYSMTYRRAFRIGDLIEADMHIGFVEEQKLLVTRLRSQKNEEIIIPNSTLLNSHIVNYSAKINEKGLIIHTLVGIGYETPWRQVVAMLLLAADRTEGLLKEPPPFVLKKSLGDFAVNYEINAYLKEVSRLNYHYTRLHQNILDVFNENNVQIMTPAYERDPEIPKIVPRDQWDLPLAKES